MKRITSIVLFASIFAVAVGTLGFGGNSAIFLMAPAVPQTQEDVGILGHVEYKVIDDFGIVKSYMQTDNEVVQAGIDCAAQALFKNEGSVEACIANSAAFTFIGIGNGSSNTLAAVSNQTLADLNDDATGTCATSGLAFTNGGDMARKNVTAGFDAVDGARIVTLDTSGDPFQFDLSNETTVIDSGIFNADYAVTNAVRTCSSDGTAGVAGVGDWNMFSRQLLNIGSGITVTDGDSLSVKWTITIS